MDAKYKGFTVIKATANISIQNHLNAHLRVKSKQTFSWGFENRGTQGHKCYTNISCSSLFFS